MLFRSSDFVAEMNQKEAYLDTSYLALKPRRTAPAANEALLVKFDSWLTGDGVITKSSYSVDDTLTLTQLIANTVAINTLEIPEIQGSSSTKYDLRDYFDFRPVSANTITHQSAANATDIVNPTEPTDVARFGGTDQKFPVPNSVIEANTTYYLPRLDRVILDSAGRFKTISGVPGVVNQYPSAPPETITIQKLQIPPYPSLPAALSADTIEIIDTKTKSNITSTRRSRFTVKASQTKSQRVQEQVRNYRMRDIAALENRVRDLEYYVSFSLAEIVAQNRFIGSTADATVDRFKFGFFVDPFSDSTYSQAADPEYYATIRNGRLKPKIDAFNLEFTYDGALNDDVNAGGLDDSLILTMPYNEFDLVSQEGATDGAVVVANTTSNTVQSNTVVTTPNTVTSNTSTNTTSNTVVTVVTQTTACVRETQRNTNRRDSPPYVYDDFFYTFSTLTGPVKLFANHRDNNMAFEISQSSSPNGPWSLTTSSANARLITQSDITNEGLTGLNGTRIERLDSGDSLGRKSYGPVGGFIEIGRAHV